MAIMDVQDTKIADYYLSMSNYNLEVLRFKIVIYIVLS